MPRLASFASRMSTWISSSIPPLTFTAATPSRLSSSCLMSSSDIRRSAVRLTSPETPTRMIGSRDGSNLSNTGFRASCGRLTRSSFSRTSSAAKSMFVPQPNSTTTSETPGREIELTFTTFGTTPTTPSTGSEIRRSTSTGAAPGYSVRTVSVG